MAILSESEIKKTFYLLIYSALLRVIFDGLFVMIAQSNGSSDKIRTLIESN